MKMKLLIPSLILSAFFAAQAQRAPAPDPEADGPPAVDPVAPGAIAPDPEDGAPPPFESAPGNVVIGVPGGPDEGELPAVPAPPDGDPGVSIDPPEPAPVDPAQIEEANGGFLIRDAAINDIFQMLAKRARMQYFHNNSIASPEFNVSGHLNGGDPLQQMDELAFQYGLTMYQKGNTVYALTSEQLNQLPAKEFHYTLRYLRPTDMDSIKALIQPLLSPTGVANYEGKTNTLVLIDSAHQVERARNLLIKIDQPKKQVIVEVKILSINSSAANRTGLDWSSSLGAVGLPLEAVSSLNSLFGISSVTDFTGRSGGRSLSGTDVSSNGNIVLSPLQINGVLRALADGGMVTQTSNPTLITEDNEQAVISLIDRVPIITTTINETEVSSNVTEEVRYRVDQSDPVNDPTATREIGVTVTVTPTILPGGTVRMKMRPRSAQIVEEIVGQSGNRYPRVSESMIDTIARIPDGHSLVIGGFYGQVKQKDRNKVPIVGDIPFLNFFFKSKADEKESTSLVFVVTPKSYDPGCAIETRKTSSRLQNHLGLKPGHDEADDDLPGPAHEPNLKRGLRQLNPRRLNYKPASAETPRAAPQEEAVSRAKPVTTAKRRRGSFKR